MLTNTHTHTRERSKTRRLSYRLVGLGSALITGVGGHGHHGFDLRGSGDDSPDVHQLTDAVGLHVSNHLGLKRGRRTEINLAEKHRESTA